MNGKCVNSFVFEIMKATWDVLWFTNRNSPIGIKSLFPETTLEVISRLLLKQLLCFIFDSSSNDHYRTYYHKLWILKTISNLFSPIACPNHKFNLYPYIREYFYPINLLNSNPLTDHEKSKIGYF